MVPVTFAGKSVPQTSCRPGNDPRLASSVKAQKEQENLFDVSPRSPVPKTAELARKLRAQRTKYRQNKVQQKNGTAFRGEHLFCELEAPSQPAQEDSVKRIKEFRRYCSGD